MNKDKSNLSGFIMNKDTPTVKIENGIVKEILNKDLMPLYFLEHLSCEEWLKNRVIDNTRINSRLLKKALKLQNKDDLSTSLKSNGACITDNYWFLNEKDKNLFYDRDINFKFNEYFNLALTGDFNDFNKKPSRTPELTNIGSFEKGWNKEEGIWYLYKKGTNEEIFSELFVYELGKKLGFNMAKYEYSTPFIKSENFTDEKKIFEPMSAIMNDNEDYEDNFNKLISLDENLARDYLKIIYLDTLVFNVDRHTENYGFMREASTGKILNLAPNFDNNLSLISRGYPKDITRTNDKLIEIFIDFLKNNEKAFDMFCVLNIKQIFKRDLNQIIKTMPFKEINKAVIENFILNGQDIINKNIYTKIIENLIEENKIALSYLYDEVKEEGYFEKCYKREDGFSLDLIEDDIKNEKITEFKRKGNTYLLYEDENTKIAINTKTNSIIKGNKLKDLLKDDPVE